MLTLLPGDESTTWNDDIVSWWSLHLSEREKRQIANTTFLVVDDKASVSDIWYTFDFV